MSAATLTRPEPTEYAPSYEDYIKLVPETKILDLLESQGEETRKFLAEVSETEAAKRHAPYTWSVKQVVGHMADAERIFGVRAMRFARNDPTALPGFEENAYVDNAAFDVRTLADVAREFALIRQSHSHLFRGFPDEAWRRIGIANGHAVTVRALVYVLAGHERHHMAILRKRLAPANA
jgi:uncharacterized damage-inducible protein DinB